jgi:uncharacterized protein YjiS (DUF1127 family)
MKRMFNNFRLVLLNRAEKRARENLRRELIAYDDRRLDDLGFNRLQLDEGVKAWPWRGTDVQPDIDKRKSRRENLNAIAELERYSDRELADMGLSRFNIREAVLAGRPGFNDFPMPISRATVNSIPSSVKLR